MNALKELLVQSPDSLKVIDELQPFFDDERRRRREFYDWVTPDMKAEFINGEIVLHSPVKKRHNDALQLLNNLLLNYVIMNKLGEVHIEKSMISLTRNDYEPDLIFFNRIQAENLHPDQMLFPAPALAVEVLSPSTEKNDRGVKFRDYEAHGVSEYWLINPANQHIEQYVLTNGEYQLVFSEAEGVIESRAIEGFAIPVEAVFDKDKNMKCLVETLKKEHQE